MFATFTEKHSTIGGIQKSAPSLISKGFGDVLLTCTVDGESDQTITLINVAYCPDAQDNLVSESQMDRKGLEIRKRKGQVNVLRANGSLLMRGHLQGSLYELNCYVTPASSSSEFAFAARYTQSLNLWHRRLAHVSEDTLLHMAKHDLVTGMDLCTDGSLGPCDRCAKGKHPQAPFPKQAQNRADDMLGQLHMDLQGPFKSSITGFRYTLAVIDDCTQAGWKRFLKHKSDVKDEIIALITELETSTERKLKVVQLNGGGEFLNNALGDWFKSKGISLEISAPDTHQQNGVAERYNRTTHE